MKDLEINFFLFLNILILKVQKIMPLNKSILFSFYSFMDNQLTDILIHTITVIKVNCI